MNLQKGFICKIVLLFAFVAVSLTGYCDTDEAMAAKNAAPTKLFYAEVNPLDSYSGYMAKTFKRRVEDLSHGNLIIEIEANGALGNDNEVLASMVMDEGPDFARVSVSYLQDYGANKAAMLSSPYIFSNHEHFFKFIGTNLSKECLNELADVKSPFVGLAFYEEGYRNFFSPKEITDLKDIEGMKVRAPYGAYAEDMMKNFNATCVRIPFTDLGQAFYSNLIDCAEQPILNYYSNNFYTWAPYLILDEHVLALSEIVISSKTWNTLTPEQQNIIKRAADYVQRVNKITIKAAEAEAISELKKKGVFITPIDDIDSWKHKCSELIGKTTKAYYNLYQDIVELDK